MALLSPIAKNKGALISVAESAQVHLEVDRHSLNTILRNLISNAVKYTGAGGTVTILTETTDKLAPVTVSDTGVGMTEDKATALQFGNPVQRTDGTAGEVGSGLGLKLCHELYKRVGAIQFIESELGAGSRFTVIFIIDN